MQISEITLENLMKDKKESIEDIENCKRALTLNINTYSGGSVKERLKINKGIVKKIDKELLLRGFKWNGLM